MCSLRNNHAWTLDFLQVSLLVQLKQLIKGILVVQFTRILDSFVWPHNNDICSVRPALKYLYQQAKVLKNKQLRNWIWKLRCSKNIQIFIWKAMSNQVPIRQYLAFSRPNVNNICPRCNSSETTIHILRDCP